MNQEKIDVVVKEMIRLKTAINAREAKMKANEIEKKTAYQPEYYIGSVGKENGAIKRASLDLTCALVEMRKW